MAKMVLEGFEFRSSGETNEYYDTDWTIYGPLDLRLMINILVDDPNAFPVVGVYAAGAGPGIDGATSNGRDFSFDIATAVLGNYDWTDADGVSRTTTVLNFYEFLDGESYFKWFVLDGDALPNFTSEADFNDWSASIDDTYDVTSGPYRPNEQGIGSGDPGFNDFGFRDIDRVQRSVGEYLVASGAEGEALVGTEGDDFLVGSEGEDRLEGRGGDDALYGDDDDDELFGEAGDDALFGEAGNDLLDGGLGADLLDGGDGSDTVSFSSGSGGVSVYLQYEFSRGSGEGVDTLISVENVRGTAFADRLIGDENDNVLEGGDGNDLIKTKGGDDAVRGGAGDDRIVGSDGDETLEGGDGSDVIAGLSGVDLLLGGAGDDFLYGGRDGDEAHGEAGDDLVRGNRGVDVLTGGEGSDNIYGGGSNDRLSGDEGNDYLVGENGADVIDGGLGDDSLTGGLYGAGGDGQRDTFVFSAGTGFDRVLDFEVGTDVMDVSSFGFADFAAVQATISSAGANGANARVDLATGDVAYLFGVEASALSADDFVI